ncbi:helix-turn-helix domain-containing protein [Kitasatospora sp. NPDC059646]|uniref:helix-turn-helix domain-containing protein n=1 Tax=Kitasatospora sp. NPDC059646 TaxID=3346893 RepID=UPI0036B934C6
MDDDELNRAIGRRIAYWRTRRRMTQEEFARLMGGKSRRWAQNIEAGLRQSDPRLSVLQMAARVLKIEIADLLDDTPAAGCVDAVELAEIRDALQRHDLITGTADPSGGDPLPIDVLRRRFVHGRLAFQAGSFAALGRLVPELLTDTNRAAARYTGEDRIAALRLLSLTLGLTEGTATKYGAVELALLAGHRAVAVAERSEDPVIMASAARQLADAMTHSGQARSAAEFAVAAAVRLEGDLLERGESGLSVLGMLYLKAAMAKAAAAERTDPRAAIDVPELLDQADHHAAQLGHDGNAMFTAFGPTNAAVHRVAAMVQLSQGADAVAIAVGIPDPALGALPRERRAHHLADLARGYLQAGRREEAVDTLLDAERQAPEEVRCRPRTHRLVEDLRLLGAGSASGRLNALAERCGLT